MDQPKSKAQDIPGVVLGIIQFLRTFEALFKDPDSVVSIKSTLLEPHDMPDGAQDLINSLGEAERLCIAAMNSRLEALELYGFVFVLTPEERRPYYRGLWDSMQALQVHVRVSPQPKSPGPKVFAVIVHQSLVGVSSP